MKDKPLIIGVAGGTGSGKTTIVDAIHRNFDHQRIVTIQHDSYYRDRSQISLAERGKINFDHPEALETDLLVRHLRELIAGQSVEMPVYDFSTHKRKAEVKVASPANVIIVEGILIFVDQTLRELLDIKIYVDTDDDIRFIRRLRRDVSERRRRAEDVIGQYLETVRPMHIEFVEPSRKYADVIFPEGHNSAAIDMVIAMIKGKMSVS